MWAIQELNGQRLLELSMPRSSVQGSVLREREQGCVQGLEVRKERAPACELFTARTVWCLECRAP